MMGDPAHPGAQRTMAAMFAMKKFDLAALQRAYEGVDEEAPTGA